MSLLRGYARKLGVMEYLGTWNASTNTPQLTSSVGQRGGYYVVSVAGTTNLNGVNDWALKDWVIFNGTVWEKIDNSELVTSVAGRTGEIVLTSNDITDFDEAVGDLAPATDHGNLTGLTDDDHTQYLLASGQRSMTGNLNMNSNQIKSAAEPTLAQDVATKNYVDIGISSESSLRVSADASLTTRLSAEEDARLSADVSLTTRLSTEESTRLSADVSLTTRLSTEEDARLSADGSLSTAISAETSSRAFSDASLSTRLSTEESASLSADISLTTRLSTEESARAVADTSVDNRLSTEESTRLSADISVFNAAVAYVDDVLGVDSSSVANFLNLASIMEDNLTTTGLIDAIAGEQSTRLSADSSLTTRLSTEESTRLSADGSLTTRLSTEESTRLSADSSLTTRLSTEESTRLSADGSLTTRVSTEESTRLSADSSLTTRVSTEESARAAEDLTFLKLDGSRSMSGSLNMNANSISNVNNLTATGLTTLSDAAITKNSINYGIQIPTSTTVSTNGTLTLTATSNSLQFLTGTAAGFSIVLPSSLTVTQGQYFEIYNTTTSSVIIKKASGATLTSLNANSVIKITAQTTAAIDGDWLTWSLEVQVASGITNYTLASTTAFATTSATDTQITSFVLTPMAGTYAVWYNASNQSTNNNALNYISLYKDTVQITGTERVTQSVASNFTFQMSTQGTATFNGAEQLRVYARVSTGTFTVNARSLIMIRLGG